MSGKFTPHNDNEKPQSGSMVDMINRLLGRIFLKKPVFFGMDEHKITLLVSPSMKIYGIYTSPDRLLKKSKLPESIKEWAKENPEKFIRNIRHVQNILKK